LKRLKNGSEPASPLNLGANTRSRTRATEKEPRARRVVPERGCGNVTPRRSGNSGAQHTRNEPVIVDTRVRHKCHERAPPPFEVKDTHAAKCEFPRQVRQNKFNRLVANRARSTKAFCDAFAACTPDGRAERGKGVRRHSKQGSTRNENKAFTTRVCGLAFSQVESNGAVGLERRSGHFFLATPPV
jgi:hypothetical protein